MKFDYSCQSRVNTHRMMLSSVPQDGLSHKAEVIWWCLGDRKQV